MADCVRKKRRRLRGCIGEMKERIFVENRVMDSPDFAMGAANFTFSAHESAAEVWAIVETVSGSTTFDEVTGLDRNITHSVIFRWISGISAETWLRLDDGRRLDILTVSNADERSEFIEIQAAEAGLNTQAVSGQ